jgi:cytochrome c-type biogenesis protein CcmH/NrfG
VGALTRGENAAPLLAASAPVMPPSAPATGGGGQQVSAEVLQTIAAPLVAAVKANPRDVKALTHLGNLYYDHKQFKEAVEYYRRASEMDPQNPDLRTDLGTAQWFLGSADKALAEYAKVLAVRPNYAPTLMNLGIVRMEGLKDYKGAIAAWKKLLETNPSFPRKQSIVDLIVQAEDKLK